MKNANTVRTIIGMMMTLLFVILEVSEGAEGLITTYNDDGSVNKETTFKYKPITNKYVTPKRKPINFEPAQLAPKKRTAPEKKTAPASANVFTIGNSPTEGKKKKKKNSRDMKIKRITETKVNGQTVTVITREMKSTRSSARRDMIEHEIITDNRSGNLNRRHQYTKSKKAPGTKRKFVREKRWPP